MRDRIFFDFGSFVVSYNHESDKVSSLFEAGFMYLKRTCYVETIVIMERKARILLYLRRSQIRRAWSTKAWCIRLFFQIYYKGSPSTRVFFQIRC